MKVTSYRLQSNRSISISIHEDEFSYANESNDRSNFWKFEGTVICSITRDNRVSSIWNTDSCRNSDGRERARRVCGQNWGGDRSLCKIFLLKLSISYDFSRTSKSWTKKFFFAL